MFLYPGELSEQEIFVKTLYVYRSTCALLNVDYFKCLVVSLLVLLPPLF